jgi:arginine utilization protein RocB
MLRIPSVSPSPEHENRVTRLLYDTLAVLPYFREHPEDLRLLPLEDDPFGRNFLFAFVRRPGPTAETVILAGHADVVSAEACGELAPFAFDPEEYTRRLEDVALPEDARRDLESGEWLFGRGVADMKSGLAAGIELLAEAASDPGSLGANLLALAVPDEENNSAGMLAASAQLARRQKEEGLRYRACIELEPTFAGGERALPSIYLGSIGKINTFFFCAGKETHVGEYYEGFGAAPVISRINLELEGNPEYADSLGGRAYPPFGCMRQTDLRREYSATIMTRAFSFYSYLTATKLPGRILGEMRAIAEKALREAIEAHERNAESFAKMNGAGRSDAKWNSVALSYEELRRMAEAKLGAGFPGFVEGVLSRTPSGADERTKAVALVEGMVEACALPGPLVVFGFLPPWYPHRANLGLSEGERRVERAARETVREASERFGLTVETRPFFEGVSDLSYCGFQGEAGEMATFAANMPGWKRLYSLPTEALAELDIPILNFGPLGKDAHKNTERLHLPYFMEVFPKLLRSLVRRVAEDGER